MRKAIVMQQAVDLSMIGGITSEFKALEQSSLTEKYEFVPMVLPKVHPKINLQDISFYYKKIREVRPDIVQIRGGAVDGLNAQIAAKLVPGTKVLLCIHGMFSELVYLSKIKKFVHKNIIEPLIFALSDGISCVYASGQDRPQLKNVQRKILPHVYNRMPDYSQYDPASERERVLTELNLNPQTVIGVFCGRFTREKGLEYLAEALESMREDWPSDFVCLLLGDGDYRQPFVDRMAEAKLQDKVRCIGARPDVYRYLLASDFMIMPSLHENHSISLLEALAADLPVVCTDVGGNGEIIHDGVEGEMCPPFDSVALNEKIRKFSESDELRNQYRNQIRSSSYPMFENDNVDKQLDYVLECMLHPGTEQR